MSNNVNIHMSDNVNIKGILSVLLCAFIECYDFLVYGNFSYIFSQMFFSQINNESLSLILSFFVFAIAFFVRPVGSLLFGYIGDRYGRRISLLISAALLIISVGGIACLPTVSSIGVLSPILLVLFRVLQGLSFGGELGAIVLLAESVKKDNVTLVLSLHYIVVILGGAAGSLIFQLCYYFIPEIQFYSWGWRIPFIIGLMMAIMLPFLRRYIDESKQYLDYVAKRKVSKVPILDIVLCHKKVCMMTVSIIGASNAIFYLFFVFLNVQQQVSMGVYCLLILALLLSCVICAILLRIYVPINVTLVCHTLFVVFVSPVLYFLGLNSVISYFVIAMMLGMYATPVLSLVVFLFPLNVRQTGFSLCYSVAVAIFGGATPVICLWLLEVTQLSISPIFYINCCSLFSLYNLFLIKKKYFVKLSACVS